MGVHVLTLLRGEATTGHWCEHCALPSVIRQTMWLECAATLNLQQVQALRICDDCDRYAMGDDGPLIVPPDEQERREINRLKGWE